ncbi:MAG: ABC transporter ATP-binding protein [Pseudomonadota bacterium]
MSLLAVDGLSKRFGGVEAVRDVGFALAAGERAALIGPNGAGKTTCFNLLTGYLRPDRGRIALDGGSILGEPPRAIWRRGVGRTFQITATFLSMTVRENAQLAALSHREQSFDLWRPMAQLCVAEADALLERVGLADSGDKVCSTLPYGDLKRLELALALAHRPRLLLMDEPTAGMSPSERAALMGLIDTIADEDGVGVLFTEHDMDVVFGHADRILVLDRGALIADDAPGAVRANDDVRRIYLGETLDPA